MQIGETEDSPFKPRNNIVGKRIHKSKKTKRYMQLAKNVAEQSTYGKLKHGAILVKGGSVLNTAYNKDKFTAFGNRFRKEGLGPATHHAEIGCLLGLDRSKTEGSTIYVVRINRHGQFRLSKPCSMCHDIMKHCGVKRVVYTVNDEEIASYKL